jgi:hypothetical protein
MKDFRLVILSSLTVATIGLVGHSKARADVLHLNWQVGGMADAGPVVGAGDVNGDGYDDVLVHFQKDDEVRLYLGSISGPESSASWSVDLRTDRTRVSIAGAGDVDGDGFEDVLIAEVYPTTTDINGPDDGTVRLYGGSPSGLSNAPVWTRTKEVSRFGFSIDGAGDLNGDGYDDVVVGDPLFTSCYGYSPSAGQQMADSEAFVFYGSSSGLSSQKDWSYVHDNEDGFVSCMGSEVSGAGDVDGDGYDDLLIGAPDYRNAEAPDGRAYLFEGSSSGLSASPDWTSVHAGISDSSAGSYGSPLSGVGDINGDGFDDVIVAGSANYGGSEYRSNRAYFFYGSPAGLAADPVRFQEGIDGGLYGQHFAGGDVDDDGYSDVLLKIQGESGYRLSLFHGSEEGIIDREAWSTDIGESGRVAPAGDIIGDGYADFIVGTASAGARVYHGGPNPSPVARSSSLSVNSGDTVEVSFQAYDPSDDPLTYSIPSKPSEGRLYNLNQDEESVEYRAPEDYSGPDHFIYEVEDPYGGTDVAAVNITVEPTNQPPEFVEPTPSDEVSTRVGREVAFTVAAEDPDDVALSYTASNLPDGASFDRRSREFRWTPSPAMGLDVYEVTFTVDDGALSASRDVYIVVRPQLEDVGVDAGDPTPDGGRSDTSSPPSDLAWSERSSGGCGCSSAGRPMSPPMSLILFVLTCAFGRCVSHVRRTAAR